MKALFLLIPLCLTLTASEPEKLHYQIIYDHSSISGADLVDLIDLFDGYLERHLLDHSIVVELDPWRAEELAMDPNILFMQELVADGDADATTLCTRIWGQKSVKLCVGDCVCKKTDQYGVTHYQWCEDGGCPRGYTPAPFDANSKCDLAALMAPKPPDCPDGCTNGLARKDVQDSADCCTVRWYRDCTPKPDEEEEEPVEERAENPRER